MEYIKLGEDRYLVKDSNGLIVNKKDIKKDKSEVKEKPCKDCVIKTETAKEVLADDKNTIK